MQFPNKAGTPPLSHRINKAVTSGPSSDGGGDDGTTSGGNTLHLHHHRRVRRNSSSSLIVNNARKTTTGTTTINVTVPTISSSIATASSHKPKRHTVTFLPGLTLPRSVKGMFFLCSLTKKNYMTFYLFNWNYPRTVKK